MAFLKVAKKAVSRKTMRRFWAGHQAGTLNGKKLFNTKPRQALKVGSATLGTMRCFYSREKMRKYKQRQKAIEDAIIDSKPQSFELERLQFFGQKGRKLLERVYRGPCLSDLLFSFPESTYFPAFIKRVERKGCKWKEIEPQIKEDAVKAKEELNKIRPRTSEMGFDLHTGNILVLDYSPEKRKFLLAIIDIGGSSMREF